MKTSKIIFGAAILGSLLSVSAFASVEKYRAHYLRTDVPLPAKVVSPTNLARCHIGTTVTLALTVDSAGQPRDIVVLSPADPEFAESVVTALAQWQFTPARQNGVPVAKRVVAAHQAPRGVLSSGPLLRCGQAGGPRSPPVFCVVSRRPFGLNGNRAVLGAEQPPGVLGDQRRPRRRAECDRYLMGSTDLPQFFSL